MMETLVDRLTDLANLEIAGRKVAGVFRNVCPARSYRMITADGLHWDVTFPDGYSTKPVIELQLLPEMVVP